MYRYTLYSYIYIWVCVHTRLPYVHFNPRWETQFFSSALFFFFKQAEGAVGETLIAYPRSLREACVGSGDGQKWTERADAAKPRAAYPCGLLNGAFVELVTFAITLGPPLNRPDLWPIILDGPHISLIER